MTIDAQSLAPATALLTALDPVLGRLVAAGDAPELRRREAGFAGLVAAIAGQQLSTASAGAILHRLDQAFPGLTASALVAADDVALNAAGLSGAKIAAVRAAAAAIASGALPLDELARHGGEAAQATLVAVRGIGPWTAAIYRLFSLGDPDAFPAGDLALQEAVRLAYDLARRPTARELDAMAERWRPYRAVAARILWSHYGRAKGRGRPAVTSQPRQRNSDATPP